MGNGLQRTVQHKPERDAAKSKELVELKKENRVLRKSLARTRKQLLKIMEIQNQVEAEEVQQEVKPNKPSCESCGSTKLTTIDIPTGLMVVCTECKHRKLKKAGGG